MPKNRYLFIFSSMPILILGCFYFVSNDDVFFSLLKNGAGRATIAMQVTSPFRYEFKTDGRLDETGRMDDSSSPYFWLNSGAYMYIKNGVGSTNQKDLATFNKWRLVYFKSNSIDSDNGYHPQNIFRLVTRSRWQNIAQGLYFKINKNDLSDSINRNASNGVLLFNRYQDGDNLYYAGLRVDGYAIIKKKIRGAYFTMVSKSVLLNSKYDRNLNPNLLPLNQWIGIKTEVKNIDSKKASIKLYANLNRTGNWTLVAEAIDDGISYGGASILDPGHAGIRADFMDVEFDDYLISGI